MDRLVDRHLFDWKNARRRKPLVLRGARQVGKTYALHKLGRDQFDELAAVDLERDRSLHRIFDADLVAGRILSELRVVLDKAIAPGRSLLLLDEIQACPRALMALRYLHEELPELHVAAAGSLLEFELDEISFPVGRVQFLELHPMCFAEYLMAVGRPKAAAQVLAPPRKLPDSVHELLLRELRDYLFVGGMPECVRVHAETRSLRDSLAVQRELAESFRQDFARYARRADPYCLDAVLAGIPQAVGRQVKYTRLAEGYSIPTIHRAFDLLCKARVVHKIRAASPAGLPLAASASPKKFKAIMVDVGLCQHLLGMPIAVEHARSDLLSMVRGALAEQFVGQELMISQGGQLHYWARQARGSTAEVDYLAVTDEGIVPVEVKSGPSGRLRSLHMLLTAEPAIPFGLVLSTAPYAEIPEQRLIFVPLYHANAATQPSGA